MEILIIIRIIAITIVYGKYGKIFLELQTLTSDFKRYLLRMIILFQIMSIYIQFQVISSRVYTDIHMFTLHLTRF